MHLPLFDFVRTAMASRNPNARDEGILPTFRAAVDDNDQACDI
jgi:hypothetical protein